MGRTPLDQHQLHQDSGSMQGDRPAFRSPEQLFSPTFAGRPNLLSRQDASSNDSSLLGVPVPLNIGTPLRDNQDKIKLDPIPEHKPLAGAPLTDLSVKTEGKNKSNKQDSKRNKKQDKVQEAFIWNGRAKHSLSRIFCE